MTYPARPVPAGSLSRIAGAGAVMAAIVAAANVEADRRRSADFASRLAAERGVSLPVEEAYRFADWVEADEQRVARRTFGEHLDAWLIRRGY